MATLQSGLTGTALSRLLRKRVSPPVRQGMVAMAAGSVFLYQVVDAMYDTWESWELFDREPPNVGFSFLAEYHRREGNEMMETSYPLLSNAGSNPNPNPNPAS
jgi:hypothetical protein